MHGIHGKNGKGGIEMARKAKRADGLMQKGFRVNGKQYTVYGHSERELLEKMQAKIEQIEAGWQARKDPTLNEYHERWMEARRASVKETTIVTQAVIYEQVAKIYIPSARRDFGDIKLKEITIDDLRIVQSELATRRNTNTTNQYMQFINHLFLDAMKERLIEYNPCCLIKPLKRTEEQARDTKHRALTLEEQKAFFDHERCRTSQYYNLYRLAVCTGMRAGEIGALKHSDIRGDCIHVARTLTRNGAGVEIGTDAKTQAGKRAIPLNDQIRQILADQKTQNAMLYGNILSIDDLLFRTSAGTLIIATNLDQNIATICKAAGIDQFTMHAFRATFATRAIEAGVTPKVLQELLGHNDISTTMNIYAHATQDTKKQAMQGVVIAI